MAGALPSIRVHKSDFDPSKVSRFGGIPLVELGFEWPYSAEGHPLVFICQIDFGEIPTELRDLPNMLNLPPEGVLTLFCDLEYPPYGNESESKSNWKLVFNSDKSNLRLLESIPITETQIKPCSLSFDPEWTFPELSDDRLDKSFPNLTGAIAAEQRGSHTGIESALFDAYVDFLHELNQEPIHRIGGYPQLNQGDIRAEYFRKDSKDEFEYPQPSKLDQVEVLLQIGPDLDADFEIYQWAYLYVLIDRTNLNKKLIDRGCLAICSA
ncbi:MAG: DUF1963 domain-containing protein [Candidatus Melainabacteria bacterium]|nr:DUF1963 domain-containing protein [Candidatus Melainabacteria bacterium]